MPSPPRLKAEIRGWRELRARLRGDTLLAGPLKTAMQQAGDIGLGAAQGAAPVASGQLKAKLGTRMSSRPVPTWVKIRTTATRSSKKYRRYRYPGRLEYDARSKRKGWLKNAVRGVWGRIQGTLSTAARAIEGRWRS